MNNQPRNNEASGTSKELDAERSVFLNHELFPPTPTSRVFAVPVTLERIGLDGFTNPAAKLGGASMLMSSGTFERTDLTGNNEKLTTLYRNNPNAKKIIDMKSEEMTRAWFTVSSPELTEDDISILAALEAKHSIKQEITNAIRWARLYGGSLAIMIIKDQEDKMDRPLNVGMLEPGDFQGLLVVDPTQGIVPSNELEDNLEDPDFGLPKYYEVTLDMGGIRTVKIHHSRVLRFIGRELPRDEMARNQFWGASELEHEYETMVRYESICSNIDQLVFKANIVTLKMGNFGSDLAYGSDRTKQAVAQALEHENELRTSYGLQVLSAEDSMETHPFNFGGLAEIKESAMMDVAGAAEIPATMMFGRSPQGMNATGESDIRNYYDKIRQDQERILRPALEKLLPVLAMCCWHLIPKDMKITFNPIMTINPTETAKISRESTEEIIALVNSGLITQEEGRAELIRRGKTVGTWGGLT